MPKIINKNPRLIWVDVMRIVAIYFVVVLHTSTLTSNPLNISQSFPYILSFALVKICVPLFVMLSGALLLPRRETYSSFFKKRVFKVLIPWVGWTFIYMAWNYTVHNYHPSNFSQWKYFFELTFLSGLWFLPLIFSLYLITPILRLIIPLITKKDMLYLSAMWFIFVCIIPYFHTGTSFPQAQESGLIPVALYYSGYFLIGFFLTSAKLPKKMVRRSLGIMLLGIALTFLELALTKGSILANNQLKFFDYFAPGTAITSIGGFLFLYSYFRNHSLTKNKQNVLIQLGSASLGIYIVHGLLRELLNPYFNRLLGFMDSVPLIQGYIMAALLFVISFFLVMILKKIPIVKLIVP